MLGALPKLFGRGFVLGFLLPSILFCIYIQTLELRGPLLPSIEQFSSITRITPVVLAALVLAVVLIALNRSIVRFLEGYGAYNPLIVLKGRKLKHFTEKIAPIYAEAKRLDEMRKTNPQEQPTIIDFPRNLERVVKSFPDREEHILATTFGNTMRAFEVYSRVVYNMEAIALWPRLYSVIPKGSQDQVSDSRAMIDFNANILILSCVSIIFAILDFVRRYERDTYSLIMLAIPLITVIYSWMALPQSAQQWGEVIKSNFDLHRVQLAKALGLTVPDTLEGERTMWGEVSRTMLFRSYAAATRLDPYRVKPKVTPSRAPKTPKVAGRPLDQP
jgi:hypothetical protein